MSDSPAMQPRLLDRVRTAIRVRHYSRRTEDAYVFWVSKYILHPRKRRDLGCVGESSGLLQYS